MFHVPMTQSNKSRASTAALRIDGSLTVARAAELHSVLLKRLQRQGKAALTLDLAEVTEIDGAGVQLLIAAQKLATAQGRSLYLRMPSPPVADAIRLMNLSGFFTAGPANAAERAR
jgi:anti-sigma B factor antagonist